MPRQLRSITFPGLPDSYVIPDLSDDVNDLELAARLFLSDLAHGKSENAQRDTDIASLGTRLGTAEVNIATAAGNINKIMARTAIESGTVTLTNSRAFPFNSSQVTIPLTVERANQDYVVDYEVTAATGNVGNIIVSAKLVNGFKLEFTGSASSVTVKYLVLGGMA